MGVYDGPPLTKYNGISPEDKPKEKEVEEEEAEQIATTRLEL